MTDLRHKILCVDDEPRVLQAVGRHLRDRFEVLTATSGAAGIDVVKRERELAVVIADMRMPEMDGATFLRHTRMLQPTAVRMLLTGQADIAAAIKAINEGQVFRFLTKPCPPEQLLAVVDEAVRQYELVIAERVLLQRTVVGSIKALADIMSLVNPAVVGRAVRLKRRVSALAAEIDLEDRWQVEAAALLSHLGELSLPEAVTRKVARGEELEPAEAERLQAATQAANRLIGHVPRLEPVSALLARVTATEDQTEGAGEAESPAAQVLRLAMEVDRLELQGLGAQSVLDTLRTLGEFPAPLLDALGKVLAGADDELERAEIPVSDLEIGMILDEDLRTGRDVLIAPRGCDVTPSFLEHIRHFVKQLDKPSVAVYRRSTLVEDPGVLTAQSLMAG
ncbi:MAG TPA: response regulator [Steroidobacteraceae bacterium]|nr:response regulator [Steroidobacteraceae bacterium]